jgi:hypothetical protein
MRISFGKYQGRRLEDIPDGYLLWVLETCDNIGPTLREAIRDQLGLGRETQADWPEIVRQWYRQMSRDYHPDRGGSHEAMQAVNDGYERLLELFEAHSR